MIFYGIRFWGRANNDFVTFMLIHPFWSLRVLFPCITGLFYLQEAETGPLVVPSPLLFGSFTCFLFHCFMINTVVYAYSDYRLVCQTLCSMRSNSNRVPTSLSFLGSQRANTPWFSLSLLLHKVLAEVRIFLWLHDLTPFIFFCQLNSTYSLFHQRNSPFDELSPWKVRMLANYCLQHYEVCRKYCCCHSLR